MLLFTFLAILTIHWVADFVLQSQWMASNKSKSFVALGAHVAVYTASIFVGMLLYLLLYFNSFALSFCLIWALVNGILHFGIDAVTSRITSYLWNKKDVHNFFVVIGLDQLLHQFCLFISFMYLMVM